MGLRKKEIFVAIIIIYLKIKIKFILQISTRHQKCKYLENTHSELLKDLTSSIFIIFYGCKETQGTKKESCQKSSY